MMSVIYEFSAWRERMEIYRASLRRPSDPRIKRAIRFMNENLDTQLPFDELARLCNLSRPHFFYLFKECTALSPALYLNTLRMESAFGRLSADETAINALAGSLGFAEANHFTASSARTSASRLRSIAAGSSCSPEPVRTPHAPRPGMKKPPFRICDQPLRRCP